MGCSRPPREYAEGSRMAATAGRAELFAQAVGVAASVSGPATRPVAPPSPACGDPGDVYLFSAPENAVRSKPVRLIAIADRLVDGELSAQGGGGVSVRTSDRHGGPPFFWALQVPSPVAGKLRVVLTRSASCGGAQLATKDVPVRPYPLPPPGTPRTSLWFTRAVWTHSLEDLYSVFIQSMFEAPLDEQPSYSALHDVLRDPTKNLLHDYLGAAEDEQGVVVRPDCADLPYFLRAYFAYKMGLPFGWSHCSRGENGVAPTCTDFASTSEPFPPIDDKPQTLPPWADPDRDAGGPWETNIKRLGGFFRPTLADAAKSGAGRTPAADETADYYPIALSGETLRPGTIFADPYGHVLVVAQRIAQTPSAAGVLLAVDGQPDGTVARKRFWRGNFLFAIDPALGSAGFKRFRPVLRDYATGKVRRVPNKDLPDYSATDQYVGGVDGFYDKMDDILNPAPLDPLQALLETVQALEEQVRTRVVSVDNGRKFLASGRPPADMPEGAKIFEASGDWEDFSTPSRDLRLLIAVDVARALPARVARRPEHYAMPTGGSLGAVRAQLEARLAKELTDRRFKYTRSDGSQWELRLADVVDRQAALEMAYNPNDCVELRWGAPAGSAEALTCGAHAPEAQVSRMQGYRSWFHDRKRPVR